MSLLLIRWIYLAVSAVSYTHLVAPASGYTSGQALQAIAEVAKENLPTGYGYELGGMARDCLLYTSRCV